MGFREWIFSDVSGALGSFAAACELAFGTIVQRTMSYPGRVRMHYGHPDVFNKLHIMTRASPCTPLASAVTSFIAVLAAKLQYLTRGGGCAGWLAVGVASAARKGERHIAWQRRAGWSVSAHILFFPFPVTQGGLSKATRQLHISEDVFGGYNHTLRGAQIKYKEYISCGKVRKTWFRHS